jgi:uncharacterized protein (DUF2141 family)
MTSKILFVLALPLLMGSATLEKGDLGIEIANVKNGGGKLYVALYKEPDTFPKKGKEAMGQVVEATGERVTVVFRSIPPGMYAVAIFQDLNGNGELDKGFFGNPKEPFGFSNNVKPSMSAPSFKSASVTHTEDGKLIQIKMLEP